jgi:hypothetical protein
MAQMITAYCRRFQLVFVETGSLAGQPVLRFRAYDGRKLYLTEAAVITGLAPDHINASPGRR